MGGVNKVPQSNEAVRSPGEHNGRVVYDAGTQSSNTLVLTKLRQDGDGRMSVKREVNHIPFLRTKLNVLMEVSNPLGFPRGIYHRGGGAWDLPPSRIRKVVTTLSLIFL